MQEINLKDEKLKLYVEYELDKPENTPIYEEELENITQITISENIEDIIYFKNLNSLMIKDYYITAQEIKLINNLERLDILHFENCKFDEENLNLNLDLKKLAISFCENVDIKNFKSLYMLKSLRITAGKNVNLQGIEELKNLETLTLQSIKIPNIKFCEIKNLKNLNLNGATLESKEELEKLGSNVRVEFTKHNHPIQ